MRNFLGILSIILIVLLTPFALAGTPPTAGTSFPIPLPYKFGGTNCVSLDCIKSTLGIANGDASSLIITPPGAPQGIMLSALMRQFDARAYGAFCDGSHHYLSSITSLNGQNTTGWNLSQWQSMFPTLPPNADITNSDVDGLAISKAFAAAKSSGDAFTLRVSGQCFASQSINLTGSHNIGAYLDFTGSTITSVAEGVPAVDLTNTIHMKINGLNVVGDCTHKPYSGVRFFRIALGDVGSGEMTVYNMNVLGCATHASFESNAYEDQTFFHPIVANADTNGGYAVVFDANNHFNGALSEALLANGQPFQNITIPVDAASSMTSTKLISPRFISTSNAPLWLSGSRTFDVDNGYFVNNQVGGTKYCVKLFIPESGFGNVQNKFRLHCEAYNGSFQNIFYVSTAATSGIATLESFTYTALSSWAATSVFGTDVNGTEPGAVPITKAILRYTNIDTPIYAFSSPYPTLFDQPAYWGGDGTIELAHESQWQITGYPWTGQLCFVNTITCTQMIPTEPINFNSELIYDNALEHTAKTSVPIGITQIADNWVSAITGFAGGKVTIQALPDTACNTANYDESVTVTSTLGSLASGDHLSIRTMIRGTDLQQINWGQGNAQPLILDVWINANYTGVVTLFATNYVGTQVITHDISVAPGCKEYIWNIPDYTSGTGMATQANYVGLRVGACLAGGTNYQVSPDVWTATGGLSGACSANTSNFLATNGNNIKIGPLRVYPGIFFPPYKQWSDAKSFDASQQLYLKSVPMGVAPDVTNGYKNKGLTGAFTFVSNVTGAATATINFQKIFSNAGTAPIVGVFSTGANTTNCYDLTAGTDTGGAATATNIGNGSFTLNCASAISGHQYSVNWTVMGQQ